MTSGCLQVSETHLGISVHHLILLDHLPADLAAMVHNGIHLCPRPELPLPVRDGGEWGDDKERAVDPPEENLREKCDGLDGFSKAHLISQNTVFSEENKKYR